MSTEKEGRTPLLSDAGVFNIGVNCPDPHDAAQEVRDFYEAKITSGELKVVKQIEVHHPLVPEEMWREWYSDPMKLEDDSFGMLVTKCCSQNPYFNSNRRESYFGVPPLTWGCPECGLTVKLQDDE